MFRPKHTCTNSVEFTLSTFVSSLYTEQCQRKKISCRLTVWSWMSRYEQPHLASTAAQLAKFAWGRFSWVFFPEIWMYLRSSNSTGTSFSWQQPGPAETDEVYQRGRCLWVQLSCLMPPLPRNIPINCYSNQPSFVPYRAVRFSEPVYSNCNKNSLTFYSKQPNLPKCTHLHSHCINSEIVPAQLPSGYVTAMMYTILVTLGAHEVPEIFLHIGGTFWTGFTVLSQYGMVALCWRSP